jgi:hypothetical protein
MLTGLCPKCGAHYYGWALKNPRQQMCGKCGTALKIMEEGQTFTGYSPFTADEYIIGQLSKSPSGNEQQRDGAQKKDPI